MIKEELYSLAKQYDTITARVLVESVDNLASPEFVDTAVTAFLDELLIQKLITEEKYDELMGLELDTIYLEDDDIPEGFDE